MSHLLKLNAYYEQKEKRRDLRAALKKDLIVEIWPKIEKLYEKKGLSIIECKPKYLYPACLTLDELDIGEIKKEKINGKEIDVCNGLAPILCLAFIFKDLDKKDIKNDILPITYKYYFDQAQKFLTNFKSNLQPLFEEINKKSTFVSLGEGKYFFNIFTQPLIENLYSASNEGRCAIMALIFKALEELSLVKNFNNKTSYRKENRSKEDIAITLLYLYGPILEKLNYYNLSLKAYNEAFLILEPELNKKIENLLNENGYIKENFKKLESYLNEIINDLNLKYIEYKLFGRIKSSYSIYTKLLRLYGVEWLQKNSINFPYAEKNVSNLLKCFSNLSNTKKEEFVNEYFSKLSDVFAFTFVFESIKNLDEKSVALKLAEKFKKKFDIKYERDYIKNPKPNGYMAFHINGFLKDYSNSIPLELQIKSFNMFYAATYGEKTNHALHKGILIKDINETLNIAQNYQEPILKNVIIKINISNYRNRRIDKKFSIVKEEICCSEHVFYSIKKLLEEKGYYLAYKSCEKLRSCINNYLEKNLTYENHKDENKEKILLIKLLESKDNPRKLILLDAEKNIKFFNF